MFATLLAVKIGLVAGSRSLLAPTAMSWGASMGWITIRDRRLAFLGKPITPKILTVLALGELVGDKLPATPSRTTPPPFAARIVFGALSGYLIGQLRKGAVAGLLGGCLGAVVGTLGGRAARGWLADAFGRDWPAAVLEDSVAMLSALLVVGLARRELS
jgi:uncharacterized membrane protein